MLKNTQVSSGIIFRHDLFNIIGGPAHIIIDLSALTVEVGEDDDFLFLELSQFTWNHHIRMRIATVEFDDVLIPPKIVGNSPL